MKRLNILVVEDEDSLYNGYLDTADELSTELTLKINLLRSKTAVDACDSLAKQEFQGAIIDLNLFGDTDPEAPSGVKVILEIIKGYRIPIVIVSGNLQHLPDSIESGVQFIKRHDRTTSNKLIFKEIIDIFQTGILNIIGGKGLIEDGLNKVFWEHLSKDIDAWFVTGESTEKSLLRYTLNHLSAYLNEHDDSMDSYREAEFYLKPPIKNIIASGDILRNPESNERFILLSPACDVEVRSDGKINAKSLVLGKISDSAPHSLADNELTKSNGKTSTVGFITKVVKGTELKCAFLPQYKELEEGIIDFQNLMTISLTEYMKLERLATVSESFFKDIQSRFSSYYARQGTPDLNKETIIDSYKAQHFP